MKNIINLTKLSFSNFLSIKRLALLFIVCFGIGAIFSPSFSVMLVGMTAYVVAYQTMTYEDSYGIDYLISYLPVTKNQYVISRYVISILSIVAACIIYTVIYFISIKMNIEAYRTMDYNTSLFMGILSSVILISLLIPVLLFFGIKKARIAMMIIFLITVMLPTIFMNGNEAQVMEIINLLNGVNINLLTVVSSVIMILISYFLSKILYIKKEII